MILYSLRCARNHEFEGWFKDSAAYDAQAAARQVACPECGSREVEKAIMAPRVGKASVRKGGSEAPAEEHRERESEGGGKPASEGPSGAPAVAAAPGASGAELRQQLQALRRHVEAHCDYVGPNFATEARKMHRGESETRGIYGETSEAEAEGLADEGIAFARVPWVPRDDA